MRLHLFGKGSYNQPGEFLRGNDPRGFVTAEGQEAALVARHEVIDLAAFGHGQQKIIRGIGGALHARQRIDVLSELLDLVDQASDVMRFDQIGAPWLVQRGAQLVEVRRAGQKRKFSV